MGSEVTSSIRFDWHPGFNPGFNPGVSIWDSDSPDSIRILIPEPEECSHREGGTSTEMSRECHPLLSLGIETDTTNKVLSHQPSNRG